MISEAYYQALSERIEFRSGKPYWLVNRRGRRSLDGIAGRLSDGYRGITTTVNGKPSSVLAHRLHWYMINGYIPTIIDHINGDGDDNHISNLRECTTSQNAMNQGARGGSSSKYKGVSKKTDRRKYEASIKLEGKYFFLGNYESEKAAAVAYNKAAVEYHGEFARLNVIEEN